MQLSIRYIDTNIKRYDGFHKGTSSLWGVRLAKGYGVLPIKHEHDLNPQNKNFDYSDKQIALAKNIRIGLYQRILQPDDIKKALYYSPVTLEFEIFSSIYTDHDGVISMPDLEEDKKEELAHAVMVYGHDKNGYKIFNHWANWGNNGKGYVSLDYLKKYFITAFASDLVIKMHDTRLCLEKKKVRIKNLDYYFSFYETPSFLGDHKPIFNIEISDSKNELAGWIHFIFNNDSVEILDIFVLAEFRHNGLGSFLLNKMIEYTKPKNVTGFISGYDLVNDRDEIVKDFLIKNGFTIARDTSGFRDCKYKILKIDNCKW